MGRRTIRANPQLYNAGRVVRVVLNLSAAPVTDCRHRVDPITIERAKRGDRQAATLLIRALEDPWFRLCRSLLLAEDSARDATQETALRFLRDLSHFRGDSSIMTWSMGIVINVVREMRRLRSAPDAHALTTRAQHRAAAGPVDAAANAEDASMIRSTLHGLTDRQREAVILRFFEDLSVEETARAMSCAPGTVKATVHQALRIMRKRLKRVS